MQPYATPLPTEEPEKHQPIGPVAQWNSSEWNSSQWNSLTILHPQKGKWHSARLATVTANVTVSDIVSCTTIWQPAYSTVRSHDSAPGDMSKISD